jgi:hypothetical protein
VGFTVGSDSWLHARAGEAAGEVGSFGSQSTELAIGFAVAAQVAVEGDKVLPRRRLSVPLPGRRGDLGVGRASLAYGGSDEGGIEELVEFLACLDWNSAIRVCRLAMVACNCLM